MQNNIFKPLLAPNDKIDLDKINYPLMASYKLDGIRCIFYKGKILSRSLKPIQNKQLCKKLEPLRKYTEDNKCVLDGEIYSKELTFQEITRFVMTKDFEDPKTIKKHGCILEIPKHLKFYAFDTLGTNEDGYEATDVPFHKRLFSLSLDMLDFKNVAQTVPHTWVYAKEDVEELFEEALANGEEGLMLRDPEGIYKFGRSTKNQGIIFKVKPFLTFDATIIGVVQATEVDPKAEKKINGLGRRITSKRLGDRILIEKASAFKVMYEGNIVRPTIAMTDIEKEEIWKNREAMIGRVIEYKGMIVGSKTKPRHPVMTRFRDDK